MSDICHILFFSDIFVPDAVSASLVAYFFENGITFTHFVVALSSCALDSATAGLHNAVVLL